MKSNRKKTARFSLKFSDRKLARPVLEGLRQDRELSVNILRGRVTREDACFQLEVAGSERRIGELLKLASKYLAVEQSIPVTAV
jgi:hypothetical protein